MSEIPLVVSLLGATLLVLGITVSTYLGLMITRGMRWPEIAVATAVMLLLMSAAILIASEAHSLHYIVALELVLLATAFSCRASARRRWNSIDGAMPTEQLRSSAVLLISSGP